MIQARHARWAESIFAVYIDRLLRKHFHSITLLGTVPIYDSRYPLLILPNHSTWWDGFFIHLLNRRLFKRPLYLLMLEEQLRKYRFFSRLGAYSIDDSPRSIAETLRYTVDILQNTPSPLLCIFPQGVLLPWHIRPLGYRRGVEHILHRLTTPVTILPLAIRCEFLGEQYPETYMLFGPPMLCTPNHTPTTRTLERTEEFLLNDIQERIITGESGRALLTGTRSTNRTLDKLRGIQE
jgi:chlorobactene lauroyltransferase